MAKTKRDTIKDLAARNPKSDAQQASAALSLIEGIRKLGIQRRGYGLTGPFGKFKTIPKSRRRMAMRGV